MRGWALLLVPLALTGAAAQAPMTGAVRGLIFDGLPPERFQREATIEVAFVLNLNDHCGQPPKDMIWGGCVRTIEGREIVFVDMPCQRSDNFAKTMCHELGHRNGWTAWHEY